MLYLSSPIQDVELSNAIDIFDQRARLIPIPTMDKFGNSLHRLGLLGARGSFPISHRRCRFPGGPGTQLETEAEMTSVTATETVKPTDCRAGGNSATMGTPESPGVAIWNETGQQGHCAEVLQGTGKEKGNPDLPVDDCSEEGESKGAVSARVSVCVCVTDGDVLVDASIRVYHGAQESWQSKIHHIRHVYIECRYVCKYGRYIQSSLCVGGRGEIESHCLTMDT